ncbi:MAG: flagellar type III secretion system pore protein FliP [Succinatimonas sp.]|nr:flagellar type III secretion system pore protein FliP [Succinatimonas sp.]MDD6377381.1 flagellar type III secretion system pore protein FliP [Succinatimonas sp.]
MIFQRAIESKEYMANSNAMLSKLKSLKKSLAISSVLTLITGLILFLLPTQSIAANLDISAFTVKTNPDGTQDYSLSLQVVILMTLLSFLPSILVMMTSFTRIVIVLAILRQAIGLQTSPSNQVLIGIAFFMTIFVMTPVFDDMYTQAIEPYMNDKIQARDAFEIAQKPLHKFMLDQTRMTDLNAFSEFANIKIDKLENVPMRVVIPAFIVSELKTAFQIGFMLFLPFLIIDLVVASILMAMGMMMLSPMIVSLPFKLMLFVLVDGWSLIMGTLMSSFGLGVAGG